MGHSGLPAPRSERPLRRPSPADTAAELVTVPGSPPPAGGDRLRQVHRPACKGATRPARSADRGCPVAAPGVTEGRPETLRGAAHEVAPRGRHRRDPYLAQRRTSSDSRLCVGTVKPPGRSCQRTGSRASPGRPVFAPRSTRDTRCSPERCSAARSRPGCAGSCAACGSSTGISCARHSRLAAARKRRSCHACQP